MFAVTTLCRVSLAICPRFYHEAWWGGLVSSLVMKLLKWNFLFFTNFVKIFCDTTQPHSTTCTDGTRTSSLLINMSRIHLFYKLLWFNKSTASTIKMGNTDIQLGSAPFISLYWSQCSMFGHQYHYIQFSLSSVLIQQYFLQILRAIEILKYSIFQISINFPFLNCVRPGQDWSVAASRSKLPQLQAFFLHS